MPLQRAHSTSELNVFLSFRSELPWKLTRMSILPLTSKNDILGGVDEESVLSRLFPPLPQTENS